MSFSPHANFAKGLVTVAPSPATSGTSLTLDDATYFPAPGATGYPVTIWPAGSEPTPANAEIALVTGKATNVLTITRAQESSAARTIIVGDQVGVTITAGILEAIEAATAAPPASLIHQASVTLTNAQIKALPTTGIAIVPTPGGDRALVFMMSLFRPKDDSAAPYTNLNVSARAGIAFAGTETFVSASLIPNFWESFPTTWRALPPAAFVSGSALVTGTEVNYDYGFDVKIGNVGTGNLTDGDAGNQLYVTVEFRVYDLTAKKWLTTDDSGWDETTRTFS